MVFLDPLELGLDKFAQGVFDRFPEIDRVEFSLGAFYDRLGDRQYIGVDGDGLSDGEFGGAHLVSTRSVVISKPMPRSSISTCRSRLASVSFGAAVKAAQIALQGVQQEALLGSRTLLDVLISEQRSSPLNRRLSSPSMTPRWSTPSGVRRIQLLN